MEVSKLDIERVIDDLYNVKRIKKNAPPKRSAFI